MSRRVARRVEQLRIIHAAVISSRAFWEYGRFLLVLRLLSDDLYTFRKNFW